jgi:hypothetical protein
MDSAEKVSDEVGDGDFANMIAKLFPLFPCEEEADIAYGRIRNSSEDGT